MSDDESRNDEQPTEPEGEAPSGDETPAEGETPEAGAAEDRGDAVPEADDGAAAEEPMSDDAAAALAAAQAAIAEAMGGDLTGAGDGAVDAAQESAESTGDDIEAMMAQAMAEEGIDPDSQPTGFAMPSFKPSAPVEDSAEMKMLGDVNVDVRVELGRTRMVVEDVLRMGEGAVVELEKLAGDPVDVFVNGRHVARGEVLVLNESFCVRVNEVLEPVTIESASDS